MLENKILHFAWILMQIHWIVCNSQQHGHLDPYGNSKSLSPQQPFDANQNFYILNGQNTPQYGNYVLATAAGQPIGHDGNGTPSHHVAYSYPTTSSNHPSSSHLWSSAPIVVADEAYNVEQTSSGLANNLQTRPRTSKALDQTNNNNNNEAGPQPLPSNYNYHNPTVYHSSDVWRQHPQQQQHQLHSIVAYPQAGEASSTNYNQQQQRQQQQQPYQTPSSIYQQQQQQEHGTYLSQQQQQHQLHASNTDLNYLQATPINHKPYFSSVRDTVGESGGIGATEKYSRNDYYSQHFKEYVRKYPRRIQPTY